MGAIGSGIVVLKVIDPISDEQRDSQDVQHEVLMQCEVPIADDFVCVVRVERFSNPTSQSPPFHRSRLLFARRTSDPESAFLLDVMVEETNIWHENSQCRTWSFVEADAVLNDLNDAAGDSGIHSEMPPQQQQLAVDLQAANNRMQAAIALADPLWRCVPPEFQDSGFLVLTSETNLDHLHEIDGFPLSRLWTAIRTTARNDNWTHDDPRTLFPPKKVTTLPDDQQLKLAQSLVYRLVADLPEESSQ